MKLSRKKAIKLCIELWEWCARTGKLKSDWPEWDKYDDKILNFCWFCEYGRQQVRRYKSLKDECDYCPLAYLAIGNSGDCYKTFYDKWEKAKTPQTRKKYAKLFLEQIKKCI